MDGPLPPHVYRPLGLSLCLLGDASSHHPIHSHLTFWRPIQPCVNHSIVSRLLSWILEKRSISLDFFEDPINAIVSLSKSRSVENTSTTCWVEGRESLKSSSHLRFERSAAHGPPHQFLSQLAQYWEVTVWFGNSLWL